MNKNKSKILLSLLLSIMMVMSLFVLPTNVYAVGSVINDVNSTDAISSQAELESALLVSHNNRENGLVDFDSSYEITNEYDTAFNGVTVTLPSCYADDLAALDCVFAVYPDTTYQGEDTATSAGSSDDILGMLDSREYFDTDELAAEGYTGKGVTVDIIDTGVDYNHPDLKDAFNTTLPSGQAAEADELINGYFYGRIM